MGLIQRALSAFGWSPLAGNLVSPWSDSSGLANIELGDLFYVGNSLVLNRGDAMKIATVSKVRNTVAGTIGRLPLFQSKAGQRLTDYWSLLAQPDPARTRSSVLTWTVDQLIFYPQTWWHVTRRDFYGWPADIELVLHHQADLDQDGNLIKIDGRAVNPRDVIRFEAPNAGLLVDADRTLRRAVVIEMAAAKAEDNPVPSFELHNDGDSLSREEIDTLLKTWVWARRQHGVGYTSKGIKTNSWGMQPEQLLIDGRKRVDLELVRHMNAQAWIADAPVEGQSLTYANLTDRNKDFVNTTLAPLMTAITDRLSMNDVTPMGREVQFDTDQLTRDDMTTRFGAYAIGKSSGFVTNEQIAAWEGWATVPQEAVS